MYLHLMDTLTPANNRDGSVRPACILRRSPMTSCDRLCDPVSHVTRVKVQRISDGRVFSVEHSTEHPRTVHDIHHGTRASVAFVPVDRISEPSSALSSLVSVFGFGFAMMPVMENRECLARRQTELVHLLFRFLRVTLTVICTNAPFLAHVRYVSHADHVSKTHRTHIFGKPAMFSSLLIGRVRIHAIECVLCVCYVCVNCAAFVLASSFNPLRIVGGWENCEPGRGR